MSKMRKVMFEAEYWSDVILSTGVAARRFRAEVDGFEVFWDIPHSIVKSIEAPPHVVRPGDVYLRGGSVYAIDGDGDVMVAGRDGYHSPDDFNFKESELLYRDAS